MRIVPTALAAALSLALVTGCSTTGTTPGQTQDNVAKALDIARTSLTVAKVGATIYAGLAPCDDAHKPPLCNSPVIQKEIDRGLNSAALALDAAESILRSATSTAADRDKAIDIATKAVAAIIGILSRYGLAG